jgi:hypothetical protein
VTARATSRMTKLLAVALVIVTVLPILIFVTDFTNSRALRAARQNATQRAGVTLRTENPDARRERIRVIRAKRHPTVGTMVMSMAFQLVMLAAIAVVGRWMFVLRL